LINLQRISEATSIINEISWRFSVYKLAIIVRIIIK
jgi:hypothetical protein